MIFRTKLDELTTRNTAGSPRAHPPRPPSCAYKTLNRFPLCWDNPFPHAQLVCPPPLLLHNLLILSYGTAT
jgi:hypothetical protein